MQFSRYCAAVADKVLKEHPDLSVIEQRAKIAEALGVEGEPCMPVLLAACAEADRRAALARRRARREERKLKSAFGRRGQYNRRVIARKVEDGQEVLFHATKGPRYYRLET